MKLTKSSDYFDVFSACFCFVHKTPIMGRTSPQSSPWEALGHSGRELGHTGVEPGCAELDTSLYNYDKAR